MQINIIYNMILNDKIQINITSNTVKYYNNLGYKCKARDIIIVNTNDLPKTSHIKISVKCDNCGEEKLKPYREYIKCLYNDQYYCTHCINERLKPVLIDKYGSTNASKLDFVKNKKKIKLNDFVNNNFLNSDKNYDKMRETCKNKYSKLFLEKSNKMHNNFYSYDKVSYINNKTEVIIMCPYHGDFLQRPDMHIQGQGCPKCNRSKGESMIENYLIYNNIKYICQMKFDDCKYKNKLLFDFYLPTLNTCIEYDGEQHFRPHHLWGEKNFNLIKIRDKIKNIYCEENNIILLRIKYNENINEKLKNNLNT